MNGVHYSGVVPDVHPTSHPHPTPAGRHSRDDVIDAALDILQERGLPGLTMRRLAQSLGVETGDVVRVTSRRGSMTLPARVVETIRPDTVFIPSHWPGTKAANQLTNRAVDPLSKMPEFKVAAVKVVKATAADGEGVAQ